MPTIGQMLIENMKKSGAGIKGTPSEMSPKTIGQMLFAGRTKEVEPEEPGLLPSWTKPIATGAAMLPTTIGQLLFGKMGKRLFTKPATKGEGKSYQDRASFVVMDLQGRGYDQEGIQKVLDILAKKYGEEPVNVEDYTPY